MLMNGMMTGVVFDGMKIANGCVAHLEAHCHLKTQKGRMRTWTQELQSTLSQ